MNLKEFIEGLEIFKKYHGEDSYPFGAEHDIFYVYSTPTAITEEDLIELDELGWFQPAIDGWKPDKYDQDESWAAYT